MKIEILGSGCTKCNELASVSMEVAKELNIDYKLEKITDIKKITEFGVILTPALVVNGEVKVVGKIPSKEDLKKIFQEI